MPIKKYKAASADEIRELRERHGLTQVESARTMGVTERTWARWEEDGGMTHAEWFAFHKLKLFQRFLDTMGPTRT